MWRGDSSWLSYCFSYGLSLSVYTSFQPVDPKPLVNGQDYKASVLKQAITAAKDSKQPIELLIKYQGDYTTVPVDYHGGLQYPHLERIKGTPDYLSQIIAPRK